jgi:hypothetical protein
VSGLFDRHAEVLTLRLPDLLDGVYSSLLEAPHDSLDLSDVVQQLADTRITQLRAGTGTESILGDWYDLVTLASNAWSGDAGDHFVVPVEGSLETVASELLATEEARLFGKAVLGFQDGNWIIRLRRLTEQPNWALDPRAVKDVAALLSEFEANHTSV